MVIEVIYIFYGCVFGLYVVTFTAMTVKHNRGCHQKGHILFILLFSNLHISSLFILNQNPRLSSHTIGVMHSSYILLLLVSGYCPLTTKMGVCWNLLESTPARIPLIDSSHK